MLAKLKHLMRVPGVSDFVLAYLQDGDTTPLLAMCDFLDESSVEYRDLTRGVRENLLVNFEG